ncbi:TPA: hypothetical protein EYO77_13940 [Candidatus Poribacteria bacterium]|nr:hypothetical protein [Candidatus Poribacteria bacterium]
MKRLFTSLLVILILIANLGLAWWPNGHVILSKASVYSLLESDMPEFFRTGEAMIAHCSVDPQILRSGPLHLRSTERPEHYCDYELLRGNKLPETRYEYIQLCNQLNVRPEKVGFLIYTVAEWTERLAVAFTEHRSYPNNPYIQQKCLVYAGILSHYAQDMSQPLHLTIHYNGRVDKNGSVTSNKGIHYKVDAIIENLDLNPKKLAADLEIQPFDNLMSSIITMSHARYREVDRVYQLADQFPPEKEKHPSLEPEVTNFVHHLATLATQFTAQLYVTAWKTSQDLKFPEWYGTDFTREESRELK